MDRRPVNHAFGLLNEDLFYSIFQYFVAIDTEGPWLLCLVSTVWRDLVLQSPSLWTRICVDDLKLDWEERFATSLLLSEQLPLHVSLKLPLRGIDLLKDNVPRWETLTLIITDDISLSESYKVVENLLGSPLPPRLSSIRWFNDSDEVLEPPSHLLTKSNLFGKCRITSKSASKASKMFDGLDQFPVTELDIWQSSFEDKRMSLSQIMQGIHALKHLKRFALDTNLIDWENHVDCRPVNLPSLESVTLANVGRFWDSRWPSQLGATLNTMKLPNLLSLELKGVPDDISSTFRWIEKAYKLTTLALDIAYIQNFTKTEDFDLSPLPNLSFLRFHVYPPSVAQKPPARLDMNFQPFVPPIIQLAQDIKHLSLVITNVYMRGYFWVFASYFPRLFKVTWSEWSFASNAKLSEDDHLPLKSKSFPQLETIELISCWEVLQVWSFQCPKLRKVIQVEHSKPETYLGKIPKMELLEELYLNESVTGVLYPEDHPVLPNLTILRCTEGVAEQFLEGNRTPSLTKLTILPNNLSARDNTHLVKLLVGSKSIKEIEFGGKSWLIGAGLMWDVDAYLKQLRTTLLTTQGQAQISLHTISSRNYPEWNCLLDVVSFINTVSSPNRIKSLKLPGFPHPSILRVLVETLRAENPKFDRRLQVPRWSIKQ